MNDKNATPLHAQANEYHAHAIEQYSQGSFVDAQLSFRLALALISELDGSAQGLGNSLEPSDPEAAAAAFCLSGLINPDFALAYSSLGGVLQQKLHRPQEALDSLALAYALKPGFHHTLLQLALVLWDRDQLDQAYSFIKHSLETDPEPAAALYDQALLELMRGDFENGWRHHEERWNSILIGKLPALSKPRWQGQSLAGKTLLITPEQGIGDVIQFVRYAQLTGKQAKKVYVQTYTALARLLESLDGISVVLDIPEDYDYFCPIMSLPHCFNTTVETIPNEVPYLRVPEVECKCWGEWFSAKQTPAKPLRVGLTWAGNPRHPKDRERSLTFEALTPLLNIPGIQWVNLQKERLPDDFDNFVSQHAWLNPMPLVENFADTAAIIHHLDLLIAVDTSTAHLAGALGKPIWMLLPKVSDWRWLTNYPESSPWYPSMRIFRQPSISCGWQPVIEKMRETLQLWRDGQCPPPAPPTPAEPLKLQPLDFNFLPTVSRPKMNAEQEFWRKKIISNPFWYHRIKLPCGLETPGWSPIDSKLYDVPERLDGLRILDIGARDGYWTFEALRRGAREVVAIDDFSDNGGLPVEVYRRDWTNFDHCREAFGFDETICKRMTLSPYELQEAQLGRFDYVFLFGVFHQLRHPLFALEKIAAICDDTLFIESPILDDFSATKGGLNCGYPDQMLMEFCPNSQFENNPANWWIPTLQTLALMTHAAGFTEVDGWKMNELPIRQNQCRGFVKASRKRNIPVPE